MKNKGNSLVIPLNAALAKGMVRANVPSDLIGTLRIPPDGHQPCDQAALSFKCSVDHRCMYQCDKGKIAICFTFSGTFATR